MQKIKNTSRFIIILIVIALFGVSSYGRNVIKNIPTYDDKPLNFGFSLGLTYMNFTSTPSGVADDNGDVWFSDVSTILPGFHVGVVSSLRLNRSFNLRFIPGIAFGQRNLSFINQDSILRDEPVPVKSTFIELPLLLKYRAVRDGNARPYLLLGINTRYDLARSKKDDIMLKPLDIYLEFGAGCDFYLMFFRFGVEARFSIGVNDMLDRNRNTTNAKYDPRYTNSISKLTSRIFIIAFNFE